MRTNRISLTRLSQSLGLLLGIASLQPRSARSQTVSALVPRDSAVIASAPLQWLAGNLPRLSVWSVTDRDQEGRFFTSSSEIRNVHVDNCILSYEWHYIPSERERARDVPYAFNLKELDSTTIKFRTLLKGHPIGGSTPDYEILVVAPGHVAKQFLSGVGIAEAVNVMAALRRAIVFCSASGMALQ